MDQMRWVNYLLIVIVLAGCAALARVRLDDQYGRAQPRDRLQKSSDAVAFDYRRDVKPVIESRCVVCHGCYDAPCQVRMGAFEGIDRGANKQKVYDGARLLAANLTRLFEDAHSVEEWRQKGFYPVLNERDQTSEANINGGVMARMLMLKGEHGLPEVDRLPDSFDFSLDRRQQCPDIEGFDSFARKYPLWGMPYGLPGLSDQEYATLLGWMSEGASYSEPSPLAADITRRIVEWEAFLNGDSPKQQLMSRYIYEHLFVGNLFFNDVPARQLFRLVRSRTPSGEPIDEIATRRPYDDPEVERVYYRLRPVRSTIILKTHMPYALNPARMARYRELFLETEYGVEALPSYEAPVASNPFVAFKEIPVESRYKFMLDEAQFTIMGFIKGPVCRGQVALNVIEDHFWVVFLDPDEELLKQDGHFLSRESNNLRLPSEAASDAPPLITWVKYSNLQKNYLKAKGELMETLFPEARDVSLNLIWDGDGLNTNAALTVFRHFDSASVVKGFVGADPKTAWVIGYPLLERIHYLLVAGFDVFGNAGHQLNSRLYMDFLRMEGEFNFLTFLPKEIREQERDYWYRGASQNVKDYIYGRRIDFDQQTGVSYQTDDPKAELFALLRQRLGSALDGSRDIAQGEDSFVAGQLQRLAAIRGATLSPLPQAAILTVTDTDGGSDEFFTLIHNNGISNVAHLFSEEQRLLPAEDTLTVARGFVTAYPNAFFRVNKQDLPELVATIAALKTEDDYSALLTRFGIRRTNPDFWQHSDDLHAGYRRIAPIEAGLFDYNRLENR